ncbi:MAG: phosphoribosylglycinamide formyltransferase [Acidimicrobiales bacterium]|nr:MAG: phosphoribosylglycinamide formyltransferase [Acidimicrobiales bacterium]
MADPFDDVRTIALSLPETNERISHGMPTFFIRDKKVFVSCVDDHHGDGIVGIWVGAGPGVQEELIEQEPDRFFRPPYVGHRGWVGVRLDVGGVDLDELREIITESFRLTAPKTLLKQLDAE